jgi:hypothetical protein
MVFTTVTELCWGTQLKKITVSLQPAAARPAILTWQVRIRPIASNGGGSKYDVVISDGDGRMNRYTIKWGTLVEIPGIVFDADRAGRAGK